AEDKEVTKHRTIIDDNSKVLIAGTLPGDDSEDAKRYYVDARNAMGEILEGLRACTDLDDQEMYLSGKAVALGDVYSSAGREGSSDGKIKDAAPNKELMEGIVSHPNIATILFNGKEAFNGFKKLLVYYYNKLSRLGWRKMLQPIKGGADIHLKEGGTFHIEHACTLNLADTQRTIICYMMPSTSGANTTLCKKAKANIWKGALKGSGAKL
ncbi:MAG: hypothetical protein LUD51_01530, partial [Clostridia bacterium]|nr:hypothetical protein [Clostridia bacterium]